MNISSSPSSSKKQKLGYGSHVISSCQAHHPFSSAPTSCTFEYVSSSTSLRNRLLLFAISNANPVRIEVTKNSRKFKENIDSASLFPTNVCSHLKIQFPERVTNFYFDATIFLELATRFDLLGNTEHFESLSKSLINFFLRMDELSFTTDIRNRRQYQTLLSQAYIALSSHLKERENHDFSTTPALECCFLATTINASKINPPSFRPKLPSIIQQLFTKLKEKYAVVLNGESWWEGTNAIKNNEDKHSAKFMHEKHGR